AGDRGDRAAVVDLRVAIRGHDDARRAEPVLGILAGVEVASVDHAAGAALAGGEDLDAGRAGEAGRADVAAVGHGGGRARVIAAGMDAGRGVAAVQVAVVFEQRARGDVAAVADRGVAAGLGVDAVGEEALGLDVALVGDLHLVAGGVDAEAVIAAGVDAAGVGDGGQVLALGFDAGAPVGPHRVDVAAVLDVDVVAGREDAVADAAEGIDVDVGRVADHCVAAGRIGVDADLVAQAHLGDRIGVVDVDVGRRHHHGQVLDRLRNVRGER